MARTKTYRLKKGKALVLRTCNQDLTSYGGFQWPNGGEIACDDWLKRAECGNGLHGLLWGEGDGSLLNWGNDAKWLVVEVNEADVVDLHGKVKFPAGVVVHCGDRVSSTQFMARNGLPDKAIVGISQDAGDDSTQKAGARSTQKAGARSTQTAGDDSTQKAGYDSTQTAGARSTQKAGARSTQKAGYASTQKAGYASTQKAGYDSTQTAGARSTQKAGARSTQTAGDDSTQKAGAGSVMIIRYWQNGSYHLATAVVGENGIKPDTWYRFDINPKEFVEIPDSEMEVA